MGEREHGKTVGLAVVVVLLTLYVLIDCWADNRDMHHVIDLQRRVGQLEQQVKQ